MAMLGGGCGYGVEGVVMWGGGCGYVRWRVWLCEVEGGLCGVEGVAMGWRVWLWGGRCGHAR